jgi:hypothetical protein
MNGWVRTESVNMYLLLSVVAQSFYDVLGEEKNK